MCTCVHVCMCACVHVCMCACMCRDCAARGPRGLRSARPSTDPRQAALRAASLGSSWVIRKVALCAAFRGHQEGCAVRGLPRSHLLKQELRCARLQGLALRAGPLEGLGRFREVALCAASGVGGSQAMAQGWSSLGCCLARPFSQVNSSDNSCQNSRVNI